jgi:HEAT repeat protein
MGAAGAAALAGVLDHRDPQLRRMVAEALGRMGPDAAFQSGVLAKYMKDDDEWVRVFASESMFMLGTPFTPRVGDIVTSLEDEGNCEDSSSGSSPISKRGQSLQSRRALQRLGLRGRHAGPHADKVASFLRDTDQGVRRRAAEALARISVDGEAGAVQPYGRALTNMLEERNPLLRTSVMEALMQMGPNAAPVSHDIAMGCKDADANVRRKAAESLGRIGPHAAPYIDSLVPLLTDEDPGVRGCAAEAMLKMGEAAGKHAFKLAGMLDDSGAGMRWYIADGLKNMGATGAQALAARLRDPCEMIRETARATLLQMGDMGEEIIKQTLGKVEDFDWQEKAHPFDCPSDWRTSRTHPFDCPSDWRTSRTHPFDCPSDWRTSGTSIALPGGSTSFQSSQLASRSRLRGRDERMPPPGHLWTAR